MEGLPELSSSLLSREPLGGESRVGRPHPLVGVQGAIVQNNAEESPLGQGCSALLTFCPRDCFVVGDYRGYFQMFKTSLASIY